jgi:putative membrane protein
MGKFLGKVLVNAVAIIIAAYLLKGVDVKDAVTAVIVAIVLGLLNAFVKPLLVLLTIPITVFTLGLFLLVINIIIVLLADDIVPGFRVNSWFTALIFSLIVSFVSSVLDKLISKADDRKES